MLSSRGRRKVVIENEHRALWQNEMLKQAYEESRYHRKYHHWQIGLSIAFFFGLAIFIEKLRTTDFFVHAQNAVCSSVMLWGGMMVFFLVLPVALFYDIFRHHHAFGALAAYIAHFDDYSSRNINRPKGYAKIGYNKLVFDKYSSVKNRVDVLKRGMGHWIFVLVELIAIYSAVYMTFLALESEWYSFWAALPLLAFLLALCVPKWCGDDA